MQIFKPKNKVCFNTIAEFFYNVSYDIVNYCAKVSQVICHENIKIGVSVVFKTKRELSDKINYFWNTISLETPIFVFITQII